MVRLSADKLGITQAEYDALVWIRDALDPAVPDVPLPEWLHFDMGYWLDDHEEYFPGRGCGTVACLGGSMKIRMAGLSEEPILVLSVDTCDPQFSRVEGGAHDHSPALDNLFYAYPRGRKWGNRRSKTLAALAVDYFLSGNMQRPWQEALRAQKETGR